EAGIRRFHVTGVQTCALPICISGCEALVRWQHPTMGLLPPKDFIPLAEESGLISAISEWVLERSCRQAAQWAKQGNPVCVSVNQIGRAAGRPSAEVAGVADAL